MIKCEGCGAVYEEWNVKVESVMEDGFVRVDDVLCPYCGSDELVEVKECVDCFEWVDVDKLYGDKHCRCRECLKRAATISEAKEYGAYCSSKMGFSVNEFFEYLMDGVKDNREPEQVFEDMSKNDEKGLKYLARSFCLSDPEYFSDYLGA